MYSFSWLCADALKKVGLFPTETSSQTKHSGPQFIEVQSFAHVLLYYTYYYLFLVFSLCTIAQTIYTALHYKAAQLSHILD